jgi:hypothetical protein
MSALIANKFNVPAVQKTIAVPSAITQSVLVMGIKINAYIRTT